MIRPLKGIALVTGSYGNPSATNQRDYWRVAVQLLKRAKVDLVILALVSAMTIQLDIHIKEKFLSTEAVAVLGIAMSIFIGFRNTQAIGRWWEARKLWGSIVNVSRNWHDNLHSLLTPQQLRSRRGQQLMRPGGHGVATQF